MSSTSVKGRPITRFVQCDGRLISSHCRNFTEMENHLMRSRATFGGILSCMLLVSWAYGKPSAPANQSYELPSPLQISDGSSSYIKFTGGGTASIELKLASEPTADDQSQSMIFALIVPNMKQPMANIEFVQSPDGTGSVRLFRSEVDITKDVNPIREFSLQQNPFSGVWKLEYRRGLLALYHEESFVGYGYFQCDLNGLLGFQMYSRGCNTTIQKLASVIANPPEPLSSRTDRCRRGNHATPVGCKRSEESR